MNYLSNLDLSSAENSTSAQAAVAAANPQIQIKRVTNSELSENDLHQTQQYLSSVMDMTSSQ